MPCRPTRSAGRPAARGTEPGISPRGTAERREDGLGRLELGKVAGPGQFDEAGMRHPPRRRPTAREGIRGSSAPQRIAAGQRSAP
jgi:hypothetical protein